MIRHPPRSTLFPYPTLSRSHVEPANRGSPQNPMSEGDVVAKFVDNARASLPAARCEAIVAAVRRQRCPGIVEDRKSTRLNSSHQIISYAVFCFKKNNKKATN